MTEIWRPIPGYGDIYEASSLGNIRSKDRVVPMNLVDGQVRVERGRVMKPYKAHYPKVRLSPGGGHAVTVDVHVLVLTAFCGPRPEGMEACHNNGNPKDNRIENLRWDTHAANLNDQKRHGTTTAGERHPMAKLTRERAAEIRARLAGGARSIDLAREYGLSAQTISYVKAGKRWN